MAFFIFWYYINMHESIRTYLNHIGLTEKEIEVYTYLLPVEAASPLTISKDLQIKRSTVYVVLDSLCEKGLVRKVEHGKHTVFETEEVERIHFLLQEKKLKTEEYIKHLSTVIPQLKATMRKRGEPPVVRFFEGDDAVAISMSELAENPEFRKELDYGVFPLELVHNLFNKRNMRHYFDLRINDNEKFKIVYTSDEGTIKTDKEGQEAILIDSKEYPLSCDISVFRDEVRVHMLGKATHGLLIKNTEFAETLASLVRLAMKKNSK